MSANLKMSNTCEIESVPTTERVRSFKRFVGEMIRTRVWLLLAVRCIAYVGIFCFGPHFQTEVTKYFAERHTEEEIKCTGPEADEDDPPRACKEAHNDVILCTTIQTMFSAFCVSLILNPAVGTWSDMFGRKLFLIYSLLSRVLITIVILFYIHLALPLYWYYPAFVVVEAFSGNSVSLAYISDVVSEEHRLLAFGTNSLTFCFGGIGGTLLTLSGAARDLQSAAIVMGGCSILATLILIFFLPESLSKDLQLATRQTAADKRGKNTWKQSIEFAWTSFLRSMKILFRTQFFRRLSLIFFLVCLTAEEYIQYTTQYLQEVLGFGTKEVAIMTLLSSVSGLFLTTVGSWFLIFIVKTSDKQLLTLGTLFVGLGMVTMAVVQTAWMAYMGVCFISFWIFLSMAISSFKANNVEANEQGAVQGALTAISALGFGIGPLVFYITFKTFRSGGLYIPGAPYYFGFGLMVFATFIAVTIQPPPPRQRIGDDSLVGDDQEAQAPLLGQSSSQSKALSTTAAV